MLYFQPVRTARFTFTLQELSIANIRQLLNISPQFIEKARSGFLRYALKEIVFHKGYEDCTLDDLTVQERLFIESTYIASANDEANFPIGNGAYLDFLQIEKQFKPDLIKLGAIKDDSDIWYLQPLLGVVAETIEERLNADENTDRIDWIVHTMAAQLVRENEDIPDVKADIVSYGDWLEQRAKRILALPESAFIQLLKLYFNGLKQQAHFFDITLDRQGIVLLPKSQEGEAELLPARFRSSSTISTYTKILLGKYQQDDQR